LHSGSIEVDRIDAPTTPNRGYGKPADLGKSVASAAWPRDATCTHCTCMALPATTTARLVWRLATEWRATWGPQPGGWIRHGPRTARRRALRATDRVPARSVVLLVTRRFKNRIYYSCDLATPGLPAPDPNRRHTLACPTVRANACDHELPAPAPPAGARSNRS